MALAVSLQRYWPRTTDYGRNGSFSEPLPQCLPEPQELLTVAWYRGDRQSPPRVGFRYPSVVWDGGEQLNIMCAAELARTIVPRGVSIHYNTVWDFELSHHLESQLKVVEAAEPKAVLLLECTRLMPGPAALRTSASAGLPPCTSSRR